MLDFIQSRISLYQTAANQYLNNSPTYSPSPAGPKSHLPTNSFPADRSGSQCLSSGNIWSNGTDFKVDDAFSKCGRENHSGRNTSFLNGFYVSSDNNCNRDKDSRYGIFGPLSSHVHVNVGYCRKTFQNHNHSSNFLHRSCLKSGLALIPVVQFSYHPNIQTRTYHQLISNTSFNILVGSKGTTKRIVFPLSHSFRLPREQKLESYSVYSW